MRKFPMIAMIGLAVGGGMVAASWAIAQQAPAAQQAAVTPAPAGWTASDLAAFSDARIAAMKAGLALRADQEKSWTSFETAYRALANKQGERARQLRGAASADPIATLRLRAQMMNLISADMTQLADAAEPLYRTLDDNQKRRLAAMMVPRRR